MSSKNVIFQKLAVFLIVSFWSNSVFAVDFSETRTVYPRKSIGDFNFVSTITVKYKLSTLFGEPVIKGAWKWEGTERKKFSYDTFLVLKFWDAPGQRGDQYKILIKPTVPVANGDYGYNVSGSPNWAKTLCKTIEGKECVEYWSAAKAKNFFRSFPPHLQEVWVWSSGDWYGPF